MNNEIAVTLAFLLQGIEVCSKNMVGRVQTITECLGFGEVELVYALIPYAEACEEVYLSTVREEGCPGVYQYDMVSDRAASQITIYALNKCKMPDIKEFKIWFKREMEEYLKCEF